MRKFIFIFFIFGIFINVNFISAIGFSPPYLVYNLTVGEKSCQVVSITSDSETITVLDKWAENKDLSWNKNLFNNSASYHKLSVSYPKELSLEERQVEVCLSGEKVGEYHGILLLAEEQQGNSVIQIGIWLKTVINEKNKEVLLDKNLSNSNNIITGSAIENTEKNNLNFIGIAVLILVILIILSVVFISKIYNKKKRWEHSYKI